MSAIKGQFGYLNASIWQYGVYNMKKPLQKKMLGYYIHKDSFLNFFCTLQFLIFFRLFLIHLIFMYVVGKYRKHSGSESLPLLRHCRDPIES